MNSITKPSNRSEYCFPIKAIVMLMMADTNNIATIILRNCLKKQTRKDCLFSFSKTFKPFFFNLDSASLVDKPSSLEFNLSITCLEFNEYIH